jgi:hypothetical protein
MSEKQFNAFDHSLVQALVSPTRTCDYEATDFHEALLFGIAREIGRVHFNHYQSSWDRWSDDPHIPGIHWRVYRYDCDCLEKATPDNFLPVHGEDCVQNQPHFRFEDVEFVWYKYPGRDMSINKEMSAEEWRAWFDRCLARIREFDRGPWKDEQHEQHNGDC